jgi:osmotically-inducible protein OsmY
MLVASSSAPESGSFSAEEPTKIQDAWQSHLRTQANHNQLFRRRRITLSASRGEVILTGVVASFYEKQLAQEFVRRFDGVQQIDNRIEVTT